MIKYFMFTITGSIPENSIAAGNPAKVIKTL